MRKAQRTRILPMLLAQSIAAITAAMASFAFMTWLVTDIFSVEDTYVAAGYEMLGTLIVFIIVMVPLNTVLYTRRKREIKTLSDNIRKVAEGDYSVRIQHKPSDPMAPIYDDFNKMCSELGSVKMLRNDFINSYSHEFRTPIASINGFASLLLEKNFPPEEQRQYLEIIADESARLSRLASSSILLSRLSSQQIVSDAEDYDVSEQIRQCSIMLSPAWSAKNIEFSCSFGRCPIHASREMLQHVWLNILDNAVKYTPEGGTISVTAETSGENVMVTISDTGKGMDSETLAHAFDPYFRHDADHARTGLGLGLAIVKRILDLSKGSVEVDSKEGEGTTFTITLPCALTESKQNSFSH